MLTHENLLADARAIVNGNNITSQSVSCAFLPFSHLYGFQVGLFVPNISGSSTIIQDELEFIKHSFLSEFPFWECITHLYSIPIIYLLISKVECLQNKLSKINCINSGGYSLSNEIREKFYKKLCIDIREGYGLSEASPVCILNSVNEPFKPGSIGRAINCCNVKIVDENNQNVKVNQIGEIVVSGYNIMKGYYNNQKITKRTIIDNWLFSGDLGRIDNEGYFYFIGTKKKMINYIGQKINPAEVKRLIKLQGNVRDIHIYGSNDPLFGQKAFANIQLFKNSNNEQEKLIKWCHENISIYKIPSKITFN
jgi:long-chain acyl-CoA synthetase